MVATLRQAFHLLGREQRWKWLLLVAMSLAVSGLEVVGAALVYVLLGLVADVEGEVQLPLVGDVAALAPSLEQRDLVLVVLMAMGVFFLVRAVVKVGATYVQQRVAHNAGARLSSRLVAGYLRWPYEVHLQRASAELIRNANEAVRQLVRQVFVPVIRIAAELVLVVFMLVLLVAIAPGATLLAVAVIGLAAGTLLLVVQPRLKRLGHRSHHLARETLATLQQSLFGIRDIRILGREGYFSRAYGRHRARFARAAYLSSTLKELPQVVMELALLGFILLYFGFNLLVGQGTQEALSVLGLFAYAGLRLQPSLHRIISGFNELRFASAPLADLDADLRAVDALGEPEPEVDPLPFVRAIRVDAVRFRYQGAARDALDGVSLEISRGEQIGVCGPTGGGKTTLVDVIAGLLEPTTGCVAVDGVDIRSNTRAWQRNLGVVPQMVFLIDDTLRRNIALGVADEDIDDVAVTRAVELAQLSPFVEELPDGLDSRVGERGVRVSGGQRQRIAIARALYRGPEVLIFDEGTSALDNATEAALLGAIERLRGTHTIILVAHRLTTVENCDRVVFVEEGRIRAVGPYQTLLEEDEAFRHLAGVV